MESGVVIGYALVLIKDGTWQEGEGGGAKRSESERKARIPKKHGERGERVEVKRGVEKKEMRVEDEGERERKNEIKNE